MSARRFTLRCSYSFVCCNQRTEHHTNACQLVDEKQIAIQPCSVHTLCSLLSLATFTKIHAPEMVHISRSPGFFLLTAVAFHWVDITTG